MIKKIIAWMLIIATTAAITVGGTLAYLTDRESEANVFTTGDVKIDLEEDFQQGAELLPGVDIEKKPSITNIGKNDAWAWATVAIPGSLETVVDLLGQNTDWDWDTVDAKEVEIDGVKYTVLTALYNKVLAKDAETSALFTGVALDKTVDIDPDGQWYTVDKGNVVKLDWNNSNGNPVIYVSAYAIQTEGFDTVEEAYAAYQTQWGGNGAEYSEVPWLIYNVEEMREAMKIPGVKMILGDDIYIPTHSSGYALYAKYDCEIDLNGHDIIADYPGKEFWGVIYALDGAKVDIVGEGNINVKGGVGYWVRGTGAKGDTEINIYGGNWITESTDFSSDSYCEGMQANKEAHINIYGGFFEWHDDFVKYTANESNKGVVTIYGGTFVNFDPRVSHDSDGSYVAEGYTVVSETQANGDVWYTVVPE